MNEDRDELFDRGDEEMRVFDSIVELADLTYEIMQALVMEFFDVDEGTAALLIMGMARDYHEHYRQGTQ